MRVELKSSVFRWSTVWVWSLTGLMTGCTATDSSREVGNTRVSEPPEVLATIDGSPVTLSDLGDAVIENLAQMEVQYKNQRYEIIQNALKGAVRERLLENEATSRGTSKEELVSSLTEGKDQVTDQEVAEWYEQNRGRVQNRSLEDVAPQIKQYLVRTRTEAALESFVRQLAERRNIVYLLEPTRHDLSNEGSPSHGPEEAPVTVVEFSDFECGYCRRMADTLDQVKESYGDQVRIVFRQFPLAMHTQAQKAAEASLCADDQGKFWPMHDLLFKEQSSLDVASLQKKADRLGLDRAGFDDCLGSGRHAEQVQRDLKEGAAVGVRGTPALFVNGIPVPGGAVPYERLAQAIEEELARVRSQ